MTLGADTGYQEPTVHAALRRRGIAPHVREYVHGNRGKNALTDRSVDPRRLISQQKRKLVEEAFGWSKLTARCARSSCAG